jgi:hypothetical protein
MDEFAIERLVGRGVEGEVYERAGDLIGRGRPAHVEPRPRSSSVDQPRRNRCDQNPATQIVGAALTR